MTIFTIPKPFNDQQINIIQRNAIKSWIQLNPKCEIFLIGDDNGVAEVAREFGVRHLPDVKKNEFGTPLLSSAFSLARQNSKSDVLIYTNCDIIFPANFLEIFKYLPKNNFLAAGRRWDLDINNYLDFNNPNWQKSLEEEVKKNGRLHSSAGIDYYIFPKNLLNNLPDFAVGRVGWDNWVIFEAKRKKIPLFNITEFTTVIHQNHNYPVFNIGRARKNNPEAKKNKALAKEACFIYNLEDADFKLTPNGLKRNWLNSYSFFKRYIKYKLGN